MNKPIVKEAVIFNRKTIKHAFLVVIISLGVFLISKVFFFISLFLLLNIIFYTLIKRLRIIIGLEFVTMSTILVGAAYGPVAGILMGVIGRLIEAFSTKRFFSLPVTLPLYAVLGYIAGTFTGGNIVLFGIILSVVYAILSGALTLLFLGGRPSKVITFCIAEIIINTLFFINLSPVIMNIMV